MRPTGRAMSAQVEDRLVCGSSRRHQASATMRSGHQVDGLVQATSGQLAGVAASRVVALAARAFVGCGRGPRWPGEQLAPDDRRAQPRWSPAPTWGSVPDAVAEGQDE